VIGRLPASSLKARRPFLSTGTQAWRSGRISAKERLDPAITEINRKTDLHIEIESIEREHHRFAALNFVIKTQAKSSARSNL
jgi:hypothetical protein